MVMDKALSILGTVSTLPCRKIMLSDLMGVRSWSGEKVLCFPSSYIYSSPMFNEGRVTTSSYSKGYDISTDSRVDIGGVLVFPLLRDAEYRDSVYWTDEESVMFSGNSRGLAIISVGTSWRKELPLRFPSAVSVVTSSGYYIVLGQGHS